MSLQNLTHSVCHFSTHILDTSIGLPGAQVQVQLLHKDASGLWQILESGMTNADGRVVFKAPVEKGDFKIAFFVTEYFLRQGLVLGESCFFIDPEVAFRVHSISRNYHVPLLVNPFGYSTYRGS